VNLPDLMTCSLFNREHRRGKAIKPLQRCGLGCRILPFVQACDSYHGPARARLVFMLCADRDTTYKSFVVSE
jgi:hypothetical protein